MASSLLHLARHFSPAADGDKELLLRFANDRDNDVFAELVRRHGPVVYRICRRLVGEAGADDAFQATFLLLATRTAAAQAATSLGGWLVGVAGRVARQMRRAARRRHTHEAFAAGRKLEPVMSPSPDLLDQFRILDEELARLPDRLREPLVSCLLQGHTQEQTAAEAGHTTRTVRRRLEEARQLLRVRLQRRGVTPIVAAGLVAGLDSVSTAVSGELVSRTVAVVFDFLSGGMLATPPVILAKGVASHMVARKVMALVVVMAAGITSLGWVLAQESGPNPKPVTAGALTPQATTTPPLIDPFKGSLFGAPSQNDPESREVDPGQRPENDPRNTIPGGEHSIVIQATCFQVKAGFCNDLGLVNPDGHVLAAFNEREKRIFQAIIRAKNGTNEVDVLSRPTVSTREGEAGEFQTPVSVRGERIMLEKFENRLKDPLQKAPRPVFVKTIVPAMTLSVTPKFDPAGGELTLLIDVQAARTSGKTETEGGTKDLIKFDKSQLKTVVHDGDMLFVGKTTLADSTKTANTELFWVLIPHLVRGQQ